MRIFPSLLVDFLWKRDGEIMCSRQWWQVTKGDWVTRMCVYVFRGQWKC